MVASRHAHHDIRECDGRDKNGGVGECGGVRYLVHAVAADFGSSQLDVEVMDLTDDSLRSHDVARRKLPISLAEKF